MFITAGALLLVVTVALVVRNQVKVYRGRQYRAEREARDARMRLAMFEALTPVVLANCRLERFGEPNDGGYLMCANLLDQVQAGYSYGISGYDQWGCTVSTQRKIPVHQYDCFNTSEPICPGGTTVFHAECVAGVTRTEEGRFFDTVEHQFGRNGDAGKRLVMKIDVEGAEWDSFLAVPDDTLDQIDQLTVEFHGMPEEKHLAVVQRLKQFFHVVHLHFNNFACTEGTEPFPAAAYEVLFVSKRLGVVDPSRVATLPHPSDAPNNPLAADCQPAVR